MRETVGVLRCRNTSSGRRLLHSRGTGCVDDYNRHWGRSLTALALWPPEWEPERNGWSFTLYSAPDSISCLSLATASGACSPFEREVVTFADRPTRGDEDVVARAGYCDTRI